MPSNKPGIAEIKPSPTSCDSALESTKRMMSEWTWRSVTSGQR
jgi:hypothetical protein